MTTDELVRELSRNNDELHQSERALKAALATAQKRIAELEAALRPFAKIGTAFGRQLQRSISYSRTEGLAPRNGVTVLWVIGDGVVTMTKAEAVAHKGYISLEEIMAAAAALQREEEGK